MLALVHICYRKCSIAYSLSALELTPSILFVFVRLSFYFLRPPRSYSCSGKKCVLPPSEPLVDHRPRSEMVRRMMNVCGGRGGIVTISVSRRKIFSVFEFLVSVINHYHVNGLCLFWDSFEWFCFQISSDAKYFSSLIQGIVIKY